MNLKELEEYINKLYSYKKNVIDTLSYYSQSSSELLQVESINKIRRYGKKEYLLRYINNPNGIISGYMRQYLYLKHIEKNLNIILENTSKEISLTKKKIYTIIEESSG